MLWWIRTLVLNWNGIAPLVTGVKPFHVVGGQSTAPSDPGPHSTPSLTYASGISPLPRLMAPASVPWLPEMRVLPTSRLCAQPWMNTPPPPCELFRMETPSMRDGLQKKLLVP